MPIRQKKCNPYLVRPLLASHFQLMKHKLRYFAYLLIYIKQAWVLVRQNVTCVTHEELSIST